MGWARAPFAFGVWLALPAFTAVGTGACDGGASRSGAQAQGGHDPGAAQGGPAPEVSPAPPATGPPGDAERGRALVIEKECNRCHDGASLEPATEDRHCVHCHQSIARGTFEGAPDTLARWRSHIVSLPHAPSLDALGARFRPVWLVDYLTAPHDLRPSLPATMPRLDIDRRSARHMVAFLTREHATPPHANPAPASPPAPGPSPEGRVLLDTRGCGTCHAFSGTPPLRPSPIPVPLSAQALARGRALAPDLRHTRARFRPEQLARWLARPSRMKPGTPMPDIPLTRDEAEQVARAILYTELRPVPPPAMPAPLPLLPRPVPFAEVEARVFRKVCWHCHADPDFALGEGGPGNTGGFGFSPRGIVLANYGGIASGHIDRQGRRRSLFAPAPNGTPLLLASLWARHREVRGEEVPGVRGMPLGLPPLPVEDIQRVASWIAQGRPQ